MDKGKEEEEAEQTEEYYFGCSKQVIRRIVYDHLSTVEQTGFDLLGWEELRGLLRTHGPVYDSELKSADPAVLATLAPLFPLVAGRVLGLLDKVDKRSQKKAAAHISFLYLMAKDSKN